MYFGDAAGAKGAAIASKGAPAPALLSESVVRSLLYALRMHESGGNYKARSRISTASGAYQYINGTWNNYKGYRAAYLAPPAVQDERARVDLVARLRRYGSVEGAIVGHFYPAWATKPEKWDRSPAPGNPTVRQYLAAVLRHYTGPRPGAVAQRPAAPPVNLRPAVGSMAYARLYGALALAGILLAGGLRWH